MNLYTVTHRDLGTGNEVTVTVRAESTVIAKVMVQAAADRFFDALRSVGMLTKHDVRSHSPNFH